MKKLTTLLLLLLTMPYPLRPAFLEHGWSVRAEGMGGAFASISNDSTAIFYNPAGLAHLFTKEVNLMFTKPYLGLEGVDISFMHGIFSYPAEVYGNFGFGITQYNVQNLYFENMIILGYAYNINELLKLNRKLFTGINLKYLTWRVNWDKEIKNLNDPIVQKGNSKDALGIDIGILTEPIEKLKIGFVVKNINSPNIGLVYENRIPAEFRLGVSYNFGDIHWFEDFTPSFDLSYRRQDYGDKLRYFFGLETWFKFHTFGLRAGFNNTDITLGGSYYRYLKEGNLRLKIDYTLLISTVFLDSLGSHKISLGIEF